MATVALQTPAPAVTPGRYDRVFYGTMAAALGLTAFTGFSATYYFRFLDGGPRTTANGGSFTALVHTHAALFTAWMLLFIVQTALISARRVAMHRRIGIAGAVLAAAMIVAGTTLALVTAARGAAPPGVDPIAFLAIPLFDMVMFSGFVGVALLRRRDKETHKRLMLLAYISIIVAAIARIPGLSSLAPPVFFGLSLVFVVAGAVYDFFSRGRVHRAYVWGGALLVLSVPVRLGLSATAGWRTFAEMLTR
jgi:hypothetical protein